MNTHHIAHKNYAQFLDTLKSFCDLTITKGKGKVNTDIIYSPFVKQAIPAPPTTPASSKLNRAAHSLTNNTLTPLVPIPNVLKRHALITQIPWVKDSGAGRISGFRIQMKGRNGSRSARRVFAYGSLANGRTGGALTGSMVDFGKSYFVHPKRGVTGIKVWVGYGSDGK